MWYRIVCIFFKYIVEKSTHRWLNSIGLKANTMASSIKDKEIPPRTIHLTDVHTLMFDLIFITQMFIDNNSL